MTRYRCKQCGSVRSLSGVGIDAVEGVMRALKRAKIDGKFKRRELCEALRWCADFLDVRPPGAETLIP